MKYTILGQGSYGCVITPPLGFKNNKLYISKIIKSKKKKIYNNELRISNKLKKIKDIDNHYCVINDVSKLHYRDIPKSLKDEKFLHSPDTCRIFGIDKEERNTQEYIAFQMPYCGDSINLEFLAKLDIKFIKHLLESLLIAKQKKIVIGDIKFENILIKKDHPRNHEIPVLIDFGGSQIISSNKKKFIKNIENLTTSDGFTAPELLLYKSILNNIYDDASTEKKAVELQTNIKYTNVIKTIKNKQPDDLTNISYEICYNDSSKSIMKLNKFFSLFTDKTFTKNFVENYDKIIYKSDVYSLGRVFYDMYTTLKLKNKKMLYLITHMIEYNYEKRFSIEECIKYFN